MRTFFHTGDMGDIIACLPSIREYGGGNLVIGEKQGPGMFGRETLRGPRFDALKPLLEACSYVEEVRWGSHEPGMVDFSTFRINRYIGGENLATWQARHVGVLIEEAPWIVVTPSEYTKGRAVFARSLRYRNPEFPWAQYVAQYPDAAFTGLGEELEDFKANFGSCPELLSTTTLLQAAEFIAGADITICNQSCPFWIAAAIGAPLMQETWNQDENSVVLRPNAQYPFARALHKKLSGRFHEPIQPTDAGGAAATCDLIRISRSVSA